MGNLQAATRALERGLGITYQEALERIRAEGASPSLGVRAVAARILEKEGKLVPVDLIPPRRRALAPGRAR
jgi:hypothetical protein